MYAAYEICDGQAIRSDLQADRLSKNQYRGVISSGMTAQASAADEFIPTLRESEFVSVETFSLEVYTETEVLVFIGQLIDEKHLLYRIEQQHQDQLLPSFRSGSYNFALRVMYITLQGDSNPDH